MLRGILVSRMNLPPGQCVKSAIDLASLDFPELVSELGRKTFTGYLAITIRGVGGIEEGTLIFDTGKIVACTYDYFRYDKLMLGSDAFSRIVNASAAKKGVVDIYQLTADQVKLTIAFNEKMVFVPAQAELANMAVTDFSPFFEEQIKSESGDNRGELLKKLKLGEADAEATQKNDEMPDKPVESDYDMFEKLVKKS